MNQIERIIDQLEILKRNLNGRNSEALAIVGLYEGHDIDIRATIKTIYKDVLVIALKLEGWNQTKVAKRIGTSEANLRYMMRKYKIPQHRKIK